MIGMSQEGPALRECLLFAMIFSILACVSILEQNSIFNCFIQERIGDSETHFESPPLNLLSFFL